MRYDGSTNKVLKGGSIMSMEYLEQYFRYCALQKKLDAKTLKAYRIDLEQLAAYLQANGLSTNRAALEQYVEQLSARCKPATVKS